jgi:hypothetical protein
MLADSIYFNNFDYLKATRYWYLITNRGNLDENRVFLIYRIILKDSVKIGSVVRYSVVANDPYCLCRRGPADHQKHTAEHS